MESHVVSVAEETDAHLGNPFMMCVATDDGEPVSIETVFGSSLDDARADFDAWLHEHIFDIEVICADVVDVALRETIPDPELQRILERLVYKVVDALREYIA